MSLSQYRLILTVFYALMIVFMTDQQCWSQTDEIQVYDASIADIGQLSATLHNNYTFDGRKEASNPKGVIPNRSLNGVPEFAYGVTDWYETGLYFPVYSLS